MPTRFHAIVCAALSVLPTAAGAQVLQLIKQAQDKVETPTLSSPTYRICTRGGNLAQLEGGLVEAFTNGALQASAQLVRLCIGEPGGFRVPLYFFLGVPGKTVGTNASNDATFASLMNPLGGYFNLNVTDAFKIWPRGTTKIEYSSFGVSYQAGVKYVNGRDGESGGGVTTAALNGLIGLRYQTAAIDLDDGNENNVGLFFVQLSAQGTSAVEGDAFTRMFGNAVGKSVGNIVLDGGIEITSRIKLRAALLRSFEPMGNLKRTTYRFAFDYLPGAATAAGEKK